MENRKRAWIYCAIDAPEGVHGTLKKQREQLLDYAKQMNFEVIGSSSDQGVHPLWERDGFLRFTEMVQRGSVEILLCMNQQCLTRSSMQIVQLQALVRSYRIQVYSPLHGCMNIR